METSSSSGSLFQASWSLGSGPRHDLSSSVSSLPSVWSQATVPQTVLATDSLVDDLKLVSEIGWLRERSICAQATSAKLSVAINETLERRHEDIARRVEKRHRRLPAMERLLVQQHWTLLSACCRAWRSQICMPAYEAMSGGLELLELRARLLSELRRSRLNSLQAKLTPAGVYMGPEGEAMLYTTAGSLEPHELALLCVATWRRVALRGRGHVCYCVKQTGPCRTAPARSRPPVAEPMPRMGGPRQPAPFLSSAPTPSAPSQGGSSGGNAKSCNGGFKRPASDWSSAKCRVSQPPAAHTAARLLRLQSWRSRRVFEMLHVLGAWHSLVLFLQRGRRARRAAQRWLTTVTDMLGANAVQSAFTTWWLGIRQSRMVVAARAKGQLVADSLLQQGRSVAAVAEALLQWRCLVAQARRRMAFVELKILQRNHEDMQDISAVWMAWARAALEGRCQVQEARMAEVLLQEKASSSDKLQSEEAARWALQRKSQAVEAGFRQLIIQSWTQALRDSLVLQTFAVWRDLSFSAARLRLQLQYSAALTRSRADKNSRFGRWAAECHARSEVWEMWLRWRQAHLQHRADAAAAAAAEQLAEACLVQVGQNSMRLALAWNTWRVWQAGQRAHKWRDTATETLLERQREQEERLQRALQPLAGARVNFVSSKTRGEDRLLLLEAFTLLRLSTRKEAFERGCCVQRAAEDDAKNRLQRVMCKQRESCVHRAAVHAELIQQRATVSICFQSWQTEVIDERLARQRVASAASRSKAVAFVQNRLPCYGARRVQDIAIDCWTAWRHLCQEVNALTRVLVLQDRGQQVIERIASLRTRARQIDSLKVCLECWWRCTRETVSDRKCQELRLSAEELSRRCVELERLLETERKQHKQILIEAMQLGLQEAEQAQRMVNGEAAMRRPQAWVAIESWDDASLPLSAEVLPNTAAVPSAMPAQAQAKAQPPVTVRATAVSEAATKAPAIEATPPAPPSSCCCRSSISPRPKLGKDTRRVSFDLHAEALSPSIDETTDDNDDHEPHAHHAILDAAPATPGGHDGAMATLADRRLSTSTTDEEDVNQGFVEVEEVMPMGRRHSWSAGDEMPVGLLESLANAGWGFGYPKHQPAIGSELAEPALLVMPGQLAENAATSINGEWLCHDPSIRGHEATTPGSEGDAENLLGSPSGSISSDRMLGDEKLIGGSPGSTARPRATWSAAELYFEGVGVTSVPEEVVLEEPEATPATIGVDHGWHTGSSDELLRSSRVQVKTIPHLALPQHGMAYADVGTGLRLPPPRLAEPMGVTGSGRQVSTPPLSPQEALSSACSSRSGLTSHRSEEHQSMSDSSGWSRMSDASNHSEVIRGGWLVPPAPAGADPGTAGMSRLWGGPPPPVIAVGAAAAPSLADRLRGAAVHELMRKVTLSTSSVSAGEPLPFLPASRVHAAAPGTEATVPSAEAPMMGIHRSGGMGVTFAAPGGSPELLHTAVVSNDALPTSSGQESVSDSLARLRTLNSRIISGGGGAGARH